MKHLQRIFLSFLFVCWAVFSIAQDKKAGVDSLMKQGEELQNAGKHTEAMEKFGEILKPILTIATLIMVWVILCMHQRK
ncbi:MAG: hypothetical protein JWQ79_1638 [Mucilaginibacter sp.]|nr:hypothetical protein [Mucilaginibacter sp.]